MLPAACEISELESPEGALVVELPKPWDPIGLEHPEEEPPGEDAPNNELPMDEKPVEELPIDELAPKVEFELPVWPSPAGLPQLFPRAWFFESSSTPAAFT